MTAVHRFDAVRRARFLGLVEAGWTIRKAAARVGTTETTVGRWRRRGKAHPDSEAGGFEADLAEALGVGGGPAVALTVEDVRRAVEAQVRRGSVGAMRVWLARFAEPDSEPAPAGEGGGWILDELAKRRRQEAQR